MHHEARPAFHRIHRLLPAIACLLAIAALPAPAAAQWGGELRLQMGWGGDNLGTVEYSDGSESDLRLGTYFTAVAGPVFEAWSSGPHSVELQALAGWSGWSTGPQNTDDRLKLNRFPLEVMAFYGRHLPDGITMIRVGAGATYHFAGGVSGSGRLEGTELDIDPALGFTTDASVVWGALTAGLRYTHMNPTVEGIADPLDGSSLGIYVGFTTPRK
ncbi:MAG TPA: hypothetical protein VF212_00500 [Longimicrobiales bacterium]